MMLNILPWSTIFGVLCTLHTLSHVEGRILDNMKPAPTTNSLAELTLHDNLKVEFVESQDASGFMYVLVTDPRDGIATTKETSEQQVVDFKHTIENAKDPVVLYEAFTGSSDSVPQGLVDANERRKSLVQDS